MINLFIHFLLSLSLLFGNQNLDKEKSSIIVKGDSSMHEWEMQLEEFSFIGEWNEKKLTSFTLSASVFKLKSDKEKMDENAYEALKAKEYSDIVFESTEINYPVENRISAKGKLSIAGTTNTAILTAKQSEEGGQLQITGSYKINMTNYNIDPPSVMFGMMKVDPVVLVKYDMKFKN